MADSKDKRTPRRVQSIGRQMAESSPNPHGEGKVIQMPVRTGQKRDTPGQNIAQTPNTAGGKLNPSVAHELQPRAGAKNKTAQPRRQSKSAGQDAPKEA